MLLKYDGSVIITSTKVVMSFTRVCILIGWFAGWITQKLLTSSPQDLDG